MSDISFAVEPDLSPEEFIDVLIRSTLSARRPVDEIPRIERMLQNADVILSARSDDMLVGVSRAITDHAWCTYLSDLAVDRTYQRLGIGKELIRRTHEAAGFDTTLILLAAPDAEDYYPRIGMTAHNSCWVTHRSTGAKND